MWQLGLWSSWNGQIALLWINGTPNSRTISRSDTNGISGGGTAVDVARGFGVSAVEVSGVEVSQPAGETSVASGGDASSSVRDVRSMGFGGAPCSSSHLCLASPQLRPYF